MRWLSVLSVLTAVSPGLAIPSAFESTWHNVTVKHAWDAPPTKWDLLGHPPANATIDLRIALKSSDDGALVDELYKMSDPHNPKYGAHLSKEEVAKLVAPHPRTLELVKSWLDYHRVNPAAVSTTHGGNWLTILKIPVRQANTLLSASYKLYRNEETKKIIMRTTHYSLPTVLSEHVQTVAPTTYFGTPRAFLQTQKLHRTFPKGDLEMRNALAYGSTPASCSNTITPTCLRALYNTLEYVPSATESNQLGITGYLDQFASYQDLTEFMIQFRPDAVHANFTVEQINGGGNNQSNPGSEADLDVQYGGAMSFPTPNTFYSTDGSPPFIPDSNITLNSNEPYLNWLNFILEQETIPQTISTLYGDHEQTVPPDYARSVCGLFAMVGLRGVSLLFGSGDNGVGAGSCLTNDGTNRTQFIPFFPASCPFVTTVGGTTGVGPEIAANSSGGGFSNYFPRPRYQESAVSSYLAHIDGQYSGLFNSSGRAYPDISAQALNFQIVFNGQVGGISGTSCSTPTAAGIISLLNDFRISQCQPPLGFLNPLLYTSASKGFNAITSGSNPGCGTQGFSAMAGWNPVTGLGTPDFLKLKGILSQLRYGC
ncbi:subtilisin-like protein [Lactifluus volemus]|nr:subtilisin-like protein [Lactifluus volemus]